LIVTRFNSNQITMGWRSYSDLLSEISFLLVHHKLFELLILNIRVSEANERFIYADSI
jgi:hypothetical protein